MDPSGRVTENRRARCSWLVGWSPQVDHELAYLISHDRAISAGLRTHRPPRSLVPTALTAANLRKHPGRNRYWARALSPLERTISRQSNEPSTGDANRAARIVLQKTENHGRFPFPILPMSASVSPLRALAGSPSFPSLEQEILQFWDDNEIYHESLRRRADCPSFVFYEGPPTANGMPHPGHCLTRSIKDVFPRYKTMRGYRCERKAGWDTHGLPVEVEVGKEMGIHSKEEIEAFGEEPFIQKCQQSVWRYMQEWQQLTRRLGFWVDLEQAYVTYHQSYVESVWWSLKNLFDRGLLYQGHKIVWWWAQGGTALSAGEVGQGYREVADPSVYVLFPLVDQPESLAGGLDDDAVDAAQQHVRRSPSVGDRVLRGERRRNRRRACDGESVWWRRSPES